MRYLAKAFLFVFLTTISSSVTSASETTTPEKCNFAPTSKITNTPAGLIFRSGSEVQFSGTTSTPNNCSGSITEYRWKIEGVYTYSSTKSHTFTLPAGVHEQTYSVELRVRNNINLYNTKTITVTVKRPQRVYHLRDHLGSVRTSVDVDGNVLGHDDYYAFGLSMPGAHSSNTSNPNDNYKFTGHELDDEVGVDLVYAGARILDPTIGRWQSIDPLVSKYPSLSPYNYVMNNPANAFDPDGRDVWFVHGTFSSKNTWSRDGIDYDTRWASALNDRNAGRFDWTKRSYANANGARKSAGEELADQITEAYNSNPDMLVQLVAHSHGGNVAIEAANILKERGITVDRLFLLGTPSRSDYTLEEGAVSEIYNFSDENDWVQVAGGIDFPIGWSSTFRISRFAKRNRPKEEAAVEVSVISERGKVESHTKLHTTQEIIDWVEKQLNDKKE